MESEVSQRLQGVHPVVPVLRYLVEYLVAEGVVCWPFVYFQELLAVLKEKVVQIRKGVRSVLLRLQNLGRYEGNRRALALQRQLSQKLGGSVAVRTLQQLGRNHTVSQPSQIRGVLLGLRKRNPLAHLYSLERRRLLKLSGRLR